MIAVAIAERYNYNIKGAAWCTDSETVIKAAKKQSSPDAAIRQAIDIINTRYLKPSFVRSALNPADGLSRGMCFEAEDLQKMGNLGALTK